VWITVRLSLKNAITCRSRNLMIAAGTRLGPYEILSQLGAGGMGEVYKAEDTKLGHSVALNLLSERLSNDSPADGAQRDVTLISNTVLEGDSNRISCGLTCQPRQNMGRKKTPFNTLVLGYRFGVASF
jgi:serine/threonine protein kinase